MADHKKLSSSSYAQWLGGLKSRVLQVQTKAAVSVNRELLTLYWELGCNIIEKQKTATWGTGFLKQLSADLSSEFPHMKGFSYRNIRLIRQWSNFYLEHFPNLATSCCQIESTSASPAKEQVNDLTTSCESITKQPVSQLPKTSSTPPKTTEIEENTIRQQPVAQFSQSSLQQDLVNLITSIPWGHNIAIISKCPTIAEALYYVHQTISHGWSRSVLTHQIESDLYAREGSATTNFEATLPPAQSDLAQQTLKDPYIFDFLTLTQQHNERDLENQLTDHISKFLIELGAGFAYLGRQVPLQVSERDFYLDLLFYHTQLHCYVVIELKTVEFEPEFAGKLNFYLKAVDETLRSDRDDPTIGILLCKSKDKLIAEYALSDISKPIGISEYQLTQSLPDSLKPSLPSIEEWEAELKQDFNNAQGGENE